MCGLILFQDAISVQNYYYKYIPIWVFYERYIPAIRKEEKATHPIQISSLTPPWNYGMNVDNVEHVSKHSFHNRLKGYTLPIHMLTHGCVEFEKRQGLVTIQKNCEYPGQLDANRVCPYDMKRTGTTSILLPPQDSSVPLKDSIYTMSSYTCNQWKWESDDLRTKHSSTHPVWPSLAKYDRKASQANLSSRPMIPGTTVLFEGLYHGVADAFHNFIVPLLYALNPRNSGYEVDYIWIEHGCSEKNFVQSRDSNIISSFHRILVHAALATFAPNATVLHRPCNEEYSHVECFERLLLTNTHSDYGRHPGGDPLDLFHDSMSEEVSSHHIEKLRRMLIQMFDLQERLNWRDQLQKNQPAHLNILVYYRKDAFNGRVLLPDRLEMEEMIRERFNDRIQLAFSHVDELKLPTSVEEATSYFQRFHDTDLLVSTHGSALTNILFMRPGSAVWEVSSFSWIHSCQHGNLCDKLRLNCCQARNPNQDVVDTTLPTDRILHEVAVKNCLNEWSVREPLLSSILIS